MEEHLDIVYQIIPENQLLVASGKWIWTGTCDSVEHMFPTGGSHLQRCRVSHWQYGEPSWTITTLLDIRPSLSPLVGPKSGHPRSRAGPLGWSLIDCVCVWCHLNSGTIMSCYGQLGIVMVNCVHIAEIWLAGWFRLCLRALRKHPFASCWARRRGHRPVLGCLFLNDSVEGSKYRKP